MQLGGKYLQVPSDIREKDYLTEKSQTFRNGEFEVIGFAEIPQSLLRYIPIWRLFTPTRLELYSRETFVLHWPFNLDLWLLRRIKITKGLPNTAADKQR